MRALIQRVLSASVSVENQIIGKIDNGILVLLGIAHDDNEEKMKWVVDKIMNLKIFEDNEGRMGLNLKDVNGELLVVSQFTLYGDVRKGTKPSFTDAAKPEFANDMYKKFVQYCKSLNVKTQEGQFQAHMMITLVNDGPVTFMIEK